MAMRVAVFVLLFALGIIQLPSGALGQTPSIPDEPAVIVVAPGPPVQLSGSRLSITCVAFGQPAPSIHWSIQRFRSADFIPLSSNDSLVEIYTTFVFDRLGYRYSVSVLELTGVDWSATQHNLACAAFNGVNSSASLGTDVQVFNIVPQVLEPAALVSIPDSTFLYEGPRLFLTCAAYGSPIPEITWGLAPLVSSGVPYDILTSEVRVGYFDEDRQLDIVTGDVVVISTLEVCYSNITNLEDVLLNYSCSVFNGEFNYSLGLTNASFELTPTVQVVFFDYRRLGNTANVDISFSAPIDLFDSIDCDIRNLIFGNSVPSTLSFSPSFPGSCEQLGPNVIRFRLDTRDYANLLVFPSIFDSASTSFLAVTENLLQPIYAVIPIMDGNQLQVRNFTPHVFSPTLLSFDIDYNSGQAILHFDSLILANSFDATRIILSNTPSGTVSQLTLTGGTITNSRLLTDTISFTLNQLDSIALIQSDVCSSPNSCFISTGANLVGDFEGNVVTSVSGLQVSRLREVFSPTEVPLYMTVSVDYLGSTVQVHLGEFEPFIAQEVDTVTRIECVSTTGASPVLGWEIGELFEGTYLPPASIASGPDQAFADFSVDGLPSSNFGIFTCEDGTGKISHFFDDDNPFVGVLNTEHPITAMLYDPVTVRVAFGQIPATLDPASDVTLTKTSGPSMEPNPPSVELLQHSVVYSWQDASYSLNNEFVVAVVNGSGSVDATASFRISVEVPGDVAIFPSSIVTIAPSDEQLTIQCLTDSPTLPVQWGGGALVGLQYTQAPPGINTMLSFQVPELSIDGTTFTCMVVDPDSPSTVVTMGTAEVRYIPYEVSIFLNGIESLDQDGTIFRDISEANTSFSLYCFASSGNYELSWSSQPVGQDVPVFLTGETGFGAEYDNNFAMVNVGGGYRGVLRCASGQSGLFAQVSIASTPAPPVMPGFSLTVEEYIGIAVVIFCTFVAVLILLFSCVCTRGRKHFVVSYLVHMSLLCAVNGSYWVFYAGVERAVVNRIGCAAIAALLQYFFSSSFTWLLCEAILSSSFDKSSRSRLSFLAFFVLGWGLPLIPTAISLGLLHQQYGTSSHCWFEVTPSADNDVLWAFVAPKLILVTLTAGVLLVGGCYMCCCAASLSIKNTAARKAQLGMIWFVLASAVVTTLLLSGAWVFALLSVNQFGSPSAVGWVFMAFSIALGVWAVLFSLLVVCLNWRLLKAARTGSDLPGGIEQDNTHLLVDNPTFMMSGLEKPSDQFGEPVEPVSEGREAVSSGEKEGTKTDL